MHTFNGGGERERDTMASQQQLQFADSSLQF
jgi:hypothetical protein